MLPPATEDQLGCGEVVRVRLGKADLDGALTTTCGIELCPGALEGYDSVLF